MVVRGVVVVRELVVMVLGFTQRCELLLVRELLDAGRGREGEGEAAGEASAGREGGPLFFGQSERTLTT